MSSYAFSRRSGGTDARPTFEYIRSNSGDRRSKASSAMILMVADGMVLWDSLLQIHKRQHRYLRISASSHGTTTSFTLWSYPIPPNRFFRSLL